MNLSRLLVYIAVTASKTLIASVTISGPIPSPLMTAKLQFISSSSFLLDITYVCQ